MTQPQDPVYQQGLQLAEAGRHEEAWACIQAYLADHPDCAQGLNDAGVILYAMGRLEQAADHLERARRTGDESLATTLWNLAEVYLSAGRPAQTAALFEQMIAEDVFNPDLAARTATMMLDQQDIPGAVEVMLLSLREVPAQPAMPRLLEQVRRARPRVAVVCEESQEARVAPITEYLTKRFVVLPYAGPNSPVLFQSLLWAQVVVTTDNDLDLGDSTQRQRINLDALGGDGLAVARELGRIEQILRAASATVDRPHGGQASG